MNDLNDYKCLHSKSRVSSKKANRLKWLPGHTWEITRSFFNYPLLLPAPFLWITRSFYPLPAPNRYSLQIDIWLIITFVKRTYIVQ
jgi:hypothetical protein